MTGNDVANIKGLRLENLSVAYQSRHNLVMAVSGVSFYLPKGHALGLWGHSGCGKSTIVKALLGVPLQEPGWITGRAWVDDQPISPDIGSYAISEGNGTIRKNMLAFHREHRSLLKPYLGSRWRTIFQEPIYSFEPGVGLYRQVKTVLRHFSNNSEQREKELFAELESLLDLLNLPLPQIGNRFNLELSGGECQRLALALSLVGVPEMNFADEPTTALDGRTREIAYQAIRSRMEKNRMSLILASHNREEISALVDSVLVICGGQEVEFFPRKALEGADAETFHPYTRSMWFTDQVEFVPDEPVPVHAAGHSSRICPFLDLCPHLLGDKKLESKCRNERPPMFNVGNQHSVACWLFRDHLEIDKTRLNTRGTSE